MDTRYLVHQLRMTSDQFINYCYLIEDTFTQTALIIDPSWNLDKVVDLLQGRHLQLTAIALTHAHDDHVNLVVPLIERYHPVVYMSRTEIEFFAYTCEKLYPINDLDGIPFGDTKVLGLWTPGHTPGGMCFQLHDHLFTGDTLFSEGCGACDLPGGSPEQMFDSIQRISKSLPGHTRIYPGHSYGIEPGKTIEEIKRYNIYLGFNREEFIEFRMKKKQNNQLKFC
ncbi:MBL fold metallo-hydrolase [Paenibacillus albidus]|uniref:MBL fold metallo-hydrolase n=1 Tax=Paenibacillus albidus TaxID=2041023 RepID=UPI001BE9B319|nr:MBL fold metallo-hydrolase [Paenibacillus albidus]MBT2288323.1 MBL fold metallo-hydrolase [Paenibacillus albidus]